MRTGRFLLAGVALLLAAAPTAMAAMGQFHGTAAFPWTLEGGHDHEAADGTFLLQGDGGRVSLVLHGQSGNLTRLVLRTYPLAQTADPRAEVNWGARPEREDIPLAGATLRLDSREAGFTAILHGGDLLVQPGPSRDALKLDLVREPIVVREDLPPALRLEYNVFAPFEHRIPVGQFSAGAPSGLVSTEAASLYLHGASLEFVGGDGKQRTLASGTHTESRAGSVYNPVTDTWVGPGSHPEHVAEYLILEDFTGHLDIQYDGLPATTYAPAVRTAVDGASRMRIVEGSVTVDRNGTVERHDLSGEDLRLAGRFLLVSEKNDPARGRATATATGDFTTVEYGAVQAHYGWAIPTAAAVGLGALAIAALAWGASHGKALLGLGGAGAVAGYARVHGADVLEHPGRAAVYQRVQADPGVSFVELAQAVGVSESTLTYHVRVLEKNEFVTVVKEGRSLRLFDRQNAHYSRDRKHAAATLRNPTTAAIAQKIARSPGVAQNELAQEFQLAASTINWHIRRLQQVGLVDLRRQHPHTRYYLGQAWSSLPAEEAQRLGMVPMAAVA